MRFLPHSPQIRVSHGIIDGWIGEGNQIPLVVRHTFESAILLDFVAQVAPSLPLDRVAKHIEVVGQVLQVNRLTEEGNTQLQQLRHLGHRALDGGIHQRLAHRFQHLVEGEVVLVDVYIGLYFRLRRRPLVGIVLLGELIEDEFLGKVVECLVPKSCDGLGFHSPLCLFQHLTDDGRQQVHLHIHFDYQIFRKQYI